MRDHKIPKRRKVAKLSPARSIRTTVHGPYEFEPCRSQWSHFVAQRALTLNEVYRTRTSGTTQLQRQLQTAQIKAFAASQGTRAKTDRIDAELIALFMAFRPDAGHRLPHEKTRALRALASKRGQLVKTRKRLLAQIKVHGKLGSADIFAAMDAELK